MEEEYVNLLLLKCFLKCVGVILIFVNNWVFFCCVFVDIEYLFNEGNLVCIFLEGWFIVDGEMNLFMCGLDLILYCSFVFVVFLVFKGLWGSYFSCYKGWVC